MEPLQIIWAILFFICTTGFAYWLGLARDKSKKDGEDLAKVVKDVEQLKVTAVSEQRVREIIKDAMEPLTSDVKDIKGANDEIRKILQHIQIDIASENAYKRGKGNIRED
jgi:hypothetical protein